MMVELPARVWLDGSMKPWPAYANKANSGEVEYIRADIADQMAEAFEKIMAYYVAPNSEQWARDTLAAYREAKG